jgi:hypothetical protein
MKRCSDHYLTFWHLFYRISVSLGSHWATNLPVWRAAKNQEEKNGLPTERRA